MNFVENFVKGVLLDNLIWLVIGGVVIVDIGALLKKSWITMISVTAVGVVVIWFLANPEKFAELGDMLAPYIFNNK